MTLPKRLLSLQSMRLVAALTIVQYHLLHNYLGLNLPLPGTDFFIVLVGMVAALSDARHLAQGHGGQYLGLRYLRLYVTFVPIFIVYLLAGRDPLSVEFVFNSFLFIPMADRLPLVGPTWMLAMFLVFYWLFSLAFVFRRETSLIPIFGLWAGGCLLVTGAAIHFPFFDAGFQMLFNIRNLGFIFGYAGGWLVRGGKIAAPWSGRLFLVGLVGLLPAYALLNSADYPNLVRTLLYSPLMMFLATGLASLEQEGGGEPWLRWLTHPWLVWLGGTSYVIYLSHNLLLRVWDTVLPITFVQIPFIILTTVVVAAVGYQFWEKPVVEWLRLKLWPR